MGPVVKVFRRCRSFLARTKWQGTSTTTEYFDDESHRKADSHSEGGVSTLTSRISLKLEEMSADHATTPELGGFHAQLRALDEMKSRR